MLGPQCPRGSFPDSSWNLANFDCIIPNGRRVKEKGGAAGPERTNNTNNNPALPLSLALFAPWHALFLAQHFQVTQRITNCFRFRFLHPQMMLRFRAKCCLYSYLTHVRIYGPSAPADFASLPHAALFISQPCWAFWLLGFTLGFTSVCILHIPSPSTFAQMGDLFSILFACYYLGTYSL